MRILDTYNSAPYQKAFVYAYFTVSSLSDAYEFSVLHIFLWPTLCLADKHDSTVQ